MTYQERIQEIGKGKKPTKLVQKAVDEYEEVLLAIEKGKEELDEADDDDKEAIQNDLNELEETADLMLLKLEKVLNNWEAGIKRVENMNQKKGAKPNAAPTPPVVNVPQPQNVQTPNPPTPPAPQKEDSSWGWLVFGGIAVILSLGAINVMKK
jgi:exonuclease VII small subunit